jgi:CO/xanthine dehydrogenase Mo-binding subunit
MDAIAHRLGLDPIDVRRRNLISKAAIPFDRGLDALGTQVVYDSGDYSGLLEKFLVRFGIEDLRSNLGRRRAAGEQAGLGIGMFVEKSGLGPFDGVRITVEPSGAVEVVTGVASLGQGVETALAQVCADALGASIDSIRIVHGQTDRIRDGRGAFASRVTAMTGPAIHLAGMRLRERIIEKAAELLQRERSALAAREGVVSVVGEPAGPSIGYGDVAAAVPLTEEEWFKADHMNYPYGIHGAVVSVDRETGGPRVERILIAYDVGRAVNPMLIEGQLAGGAAQGLGGALLEEFHYDELGQPLSATFVDYLLPTASEMAVVDMLLCEDAPSPLNPLGVKGAGEGGITAMGAAIAAATDEALGRPGLVRRLPIPLELLRKS